MTIRVTIVMLNHSIASTITGPLEVLMSAGVVWNLFTSRPASPVFSVTLASVNGKACTSQSGLTISAHCKLEDAGEADVILLTSAGINPQLSEEHLTAITWLKEQHGKGKLLCSVCAGAALFAAAGLLDGRDATTHWGLINEFKHRFPLVEWRPDSLIVDLGDIITCGGGMAGNDLALYLVEKYSGKKVALECAQTLLLENGRHLQAPFVELLHHKTHSDIGIRQAQAFMDSHFSESLSLDALAEKINMSPRNFKRRFQSATGEAPLAYLQKLRMQAAKNMLVTTNHSIDEIALSVSYQDSNHFRKLFKRMTRLSPTQFKERFQRQPV